MHSPLYPVLIFRMHMFTAVKEAMAVAFDSTEDATFVKTRAEEKREIE